MKGDFTKFRFGNESRYTDVLQQQGRVSLDSDWNESAAINNWQRRQRTIDAFGRFAAIGDAFRATYLPNFDDIVFEPGRAYVAGLLTEWQTDAPIEVRFRKTASGLVLTSGRSLEAGGIYRLRLEGVDDGVFVRIDDVDDGEFPASVAFDDDLESLPDSGQGMAVAVVSYRTQDVDVGGPFAEGGDDVAPARQSRVLVLDVWQRHITSVEDPGLLEEALGGPDTTTRLATDWAVRMLPVAQDATCSTDPPNLGRGGAGVPGRMSAWVVPSEDFEDPCLLPTDAGYRGLENRLYRVEVHEGNEGTSLDGVTFKWSRNNAASVAAVTQNNGDTLEVTDLGSDEDGLRAAPLVEVFDRVNERTTSPGILLEPIANVDPTNNEIEFSQDVSDANGRPWQDDLRTRRWDGLISDVEQGEEIELELGISVSFTEGSYRPGDYWLIPARTVTGRIQELDEAPPVGVVHHYAKLAVARRDDGAVSVTDCRPCLRPITSMTAECSPLITVGDCGDVRTLPEAIDRIEGDVAAFPADIVATVKLLQGDHRLTAPVAIRRPNFRLTGCGVESRLVASDSFSALAIGAEAATTINNVSIDNLAVHGAAPRGLIAARSVHGLHLRNLTMTLDTALLEPEGAAAIAMSTCRKASIVACRLVGQAAVSDLGEDGALLRFPQFGTVSIDGDSVLVRDNRISGAGIWIRHGSTDVRVDDNEIDGGVQARSFSRSFAGVVLGGIDPTMPRDKSASEITPDDLALSGVRITRNRILRRTGSGIATLAADAVNVNYPGFDLLPIPVDPGAIPVGDLISASWCFDRVSVAKPFVLNHDAYAGWIEEELDVPQAANIATPLLWALPHMPLRVFDVAGRLMSPLAEPQQLVIESNDIRGCADSSSPDRRLSASVQGGVVLDGVREVDITDNDIIGNGVRGRAVGIWVDDALEIRIHGNRIEGNGKEDPPDDPPRLVDFTDVVFAEAKTNFAGIEMFSAPYKKANLSISKIVSNPTTQPLDVVGTMPGQPLGPLVDDEVQISFAEGTFSPMLGMSFLPSKTGEEPVSGVVDLVDDSQVDVVIDPAVDYFAEFEQPVKGLRFTPTVPLILTTIFWGPVNVQAGVVVLGATGSRAFGKAGRRTMSFEGNTIQTPAGPALAAQVVGDGSVVDNVLVSEAYAPQPRSLISRLGSASKTATGACVAVEQRSSLISPFLFTRAVFGTATSRNSRLLNTSLRFAGNQVRQSVSSNTDIDQSLPAIVSLRADDVDVTHNVVEALLSRGDARTNVLIGSSTGRIVSNRLAEVTCSTELSLEVRVSGQATIVDNQADHGVAVTRPDGSSVPIDPSNATKLAGCSRVDLPVATLFFAGLLAGAFAIKEPVEVPATAVEVTDAYLGVLAASRDASLDEWQADAARKVVRSVSSLQIAKETLEEGGEVDPDLSTYRPARDIGELGETYREITDVVATMRPGVFSLPEVTGGLVRTVDGGVVENARVILETDEGVVEELEASEEGRIDGGRLAGALERARERGGDIRYRIESRSGDLLDHGAIGRISPDSPELFDLTVRPR